jgi:hypothetical protein
MVDTQKFLDDWVRDNVQSAAFRNKAEGRRLTYECRKATASAGLTWPSVIKAANGDIEGYILSALNRAADAEAEHV